LVTLRAASSTGNIASRSPYSYASGVLIKSNMPATIAETVFITNPNEARLLANGTGVRQQEIAAKLRQGVRKYLLGTP
jgi:N-acetylmuramoyl-L-alanine amidase